MAMSPAERSGAPLSSRTVHGEGADVAVPLLTATAKVLEFIREEVVDRAGSMSLRAGDLGWVLTVPASWDEAAKAFMRAAAVEAGLIPDVDSDRLQLALEPEGAVIASTLDAPADVRARLVIGQRVLVLDCGGGTVDCTVSEIVGTDPPRLRELLPPSGGSWGGTHVDAEFRKFVNAVLLPEGARASDAHADAAASAAALDAWETAKCGWDAGDKITVSGLATVCEYVGGPEEMARRVAAYNARAGLEGGDAVVYRPRSFSLVLPPGVVQRFFDACVAPICGHMQSLFVSAAELGRPMDFVFLVGGFAESMYLQRQVRDRPDLLGAFIEETLRLEPPFRAHYRHVRSDTELAGTALPRDSRVLLLWGAANRDPDHFQDPDSFRLDRSVGKGHLSFGKGIHFCLGAPLARLETITVLRMLFDRTEWFDAAEVGPWLPSVLARRREFLRLTVR